MGSAADVLDVRSIIIIIKIVIEYTRWQKIYVIDKKILLFLFLYTFYNFK